MLNRTLLSQSLKFITFASLISFSAQSHSNSYISASTAQSLSNYSSSLSEQVSQATAHYQQTHNSASVEQAHGTAPSVQAHGSAKSVLAHSSAQDHNADYLNAASLANEQHTALAASSVRTINESNSTADGQSLASAEQEHQDFAAKSHSMGRDGAYATAIAANPHDSDSVVNAAVTHGNAVAYAHVGGAAMQETKHGDEDVTIAATVVTSADNSDGHGLIAPSVQSDSVASINGQVVSKDSSSMYAQNLGASPEYTVSALKQAAAAASHGGIHTTVKGNRVSTVIYPPFGKSKAADNAGITKAQLSAVANQASAISVGSRLGTNASVSAQDKLANASVSAQAQIAPQPQVTGNQRVQTTIFAPPGGIERSKIPGTNVTKALISTVKTTRYNTNAQPNKMAAAGDIALAGIEIVEAPEIEDAVTKAKLKTMLDALIGRKVSSDLLQDMGNNIKDFYQDLGYLNCETYMPQQEIDLDNVVFKIGIKATELNKVHIENNSQVRDGYIEYLLSSLKDYEGKHLNYHDFYEQMLMLNDLGTFNLQGQFDAVTPDNVVNNLDLMAINGTDRAYFTSAIDNFGSLSSGRYRMSGNFEINNPTASADRLNLFYSHTDEDQADYSIGYTIPVSSHPTLVGASLCYSHADLGGIYRELGTKNEELTFEAFVREPLYRDTNAIANVQFGYIYRKMSTDFSVFELKTKKHSNTAYVQFSGSKNFVGNAIVSSSLRLSAGRIENDDDYDLGIEGNFIKLNGNVGFNFILADNVSTVTNVNVQVANTMLDGSEVMQAGGENGLLAYQASDLCGDSGIIVGQSLQYMPDASLGLVIAPHIEAAKLFTHDYDAQRAASAGISLFYNRDSVNAMLDFSHVVGNQIDYVNDSSRINFKLSYTF
ncbi:MAG: ShlB/FhaC/HecB family hemolysin secretion/activation protein [Anaerobiospirillum succiniciproducens]|uniref:ShlB/FhaC/HecB family hemolysin secretion/activation protein n=1 Tax=Anaerobiospirillum succiniciproducens TaxID=13335 RepID=UPI002A74CCC0|nr:ShlB/FhaC/HecB family hemolysin secretion/activation protein [Anaerobiospirillum succiniciproducens]MDY2799412.1 ShlB/FhaC/HecB family hemolysin secretion/activation protein [Anaerobiospirillum succiniciproducens]